MHCSSTSGILSIIAVKEYNGTSFAKEYTKVRDIRFHCDLLRPAFHIVICKICSTQEEVDQVAIQMIYDMLYLECNYGKIPAELAVVTI